MSDDRVSMDRKVRENFARRLRSAMAEANINHTGLAREISSSRSTVSKYCAGVQTPTLLIFSRICRALNVNYSRLLGE